MQVIPIPVDTSAHDGGVYVQPIEGGCHIHVETEADGVGEVMQASDGENSYSAEVRRIFQPDTRDVVAGRATFTVSEGVTLTTTNTDPVVNASAPA